MRVYLILVFSTICPFFLSAGFDIDKSNFEKIGMDINMTYFRNMDGSVTLQAEVYDEEDYEAITDLEFIFYSISEQGEYQILGKAFSNEEAIVELSGIPFDKIYRNKTDQMTFRIFGENDIYKGSIDLSIRHVNLKLNFDIIDSEKRVSVLLTGLDENGEITGIADGEIYFYVPRSFFGRLAIGDVWTDENGYDKMIFPDDIPGDKLGNLDVIAKIADNKDFGNIEVSERIAWGTKTIQDAEREERNLWASGANAPIVLLILVNSLIAVIWGIIFFIIYRIYEISKIT